MPHELTITGVYYADVLRKLHVTINPSIHHVYFRQLLGPHQRYVHRYIRSAEERWPRYPYFCMTIPLLLRDNACSQVTCLTCCCPWVWIWRNAQSNIFTWACTKWLPPVSKFTKHLRGQRILTDDELKSEHILQALKNSKITTNWVLTKAVIISKFNVSAFVHLLFKQVWLKTFLPRPRTCVLNPVSKRQALAVG